MLGAAITALFGLGAYKYDQEQLHNLFYQEAQASSVAYRQRVARSVDAVNAMASRLQRETSLSRAEFRALMRPELERSGGITSVFYAPRVNDRDRAAFEAEQRRAGYIGYRIRTQAGGENAQSRRYPVQFVTPWRMRRVDWLGVDIAPYADFEKWRDGEGAAPLMGRFPQGGEAARRMAGDGLGLAALIANPNSGRLWIGAPVYLGGAVHPTQAGRSQLIRGLVAAEIDIDALFRTPAMGGKALSSVSLTEPPAVGKRFAFQESFAFSLGDYTIYTTYRLPYRAAEWNTLLLCAALFSGLLVTVLLVVSVQVAAARHRDLVARNRVIAQQVAEQTAALSEARIRAEKAADEAQTAREEAEAAEQRKGEFLAFVSHEIRTPMNGVFGLLAALDQTPLSGDQRELIRLLRQSGDLMLSLLNDVLDASKMEAGKLTIERAPFSLFAVLKSIEIMYTERARDKAFRFVLDVAPDVADQRLGDSHRLQQILHNLLSNAFKFTDKGEVTLKVAAQSRNRVRFEVRDTGIGLNKAETDRIFERFAQADVSTTRRYGGTGLGLSIVKGLVAAQDGEISVDSTPGEGSVFRVDLRLPSAKGAETPSPRAAPTPDQNNDLRGLRILAVDDNAVNRQVLDAMLRSANVDLTFAVNGPDAIAGWRNGVFDLVLMDVQMPGMSGAEATREIRNCERSEGRARTPIIALTAHQLDDVKLAADGFDGYVGKPIQPALLIAAIVQAMEVNHADPLGEAEKAAS